MTTQRDPNTDAARTIIHRVELVQAPAPTVTVAPTHHSSWDGVGQLLAVIAALAVAILLVNHLWSSGPRAPAGGGPAASVMRHADVIGSRPCRLSDGSWGSTGTRNGSAFCFRGVR